MIFQLNLCRRKYQLLSFFVFVVVVVVVVVVIPFSTDLGKMCTMVHLPFNCIFPDINCLFRPSLFVSPSYCCAVL